jgi:hypothetical protein
MTKIKKVWFYIPFLVINYIAFIEPVRRYYEHRIYRQDIGLDARNLYLGAFFDLLARFPFGVGFGNSLDEYYNIKPADNLWDGYNSFYLHLFSRIGIQGIIIFVVILFLIVKYLFRESNKIEDPNIRYFVFGGACGLIVQQLNFIVNNIYQLPGGMLNFWVMCGMLVTITNLYKKTSTT